LASIIDGQLDMIFLAFSRSWRNFSTTIFNSTYRVQMLSSLRQCAVTLTRIHTSKVKVTWHIKGQSTHACVPL